MNPSGIDADESVANRSSGLLRLIHLRHYALAILSVGVALGASLVLEHFHFRVPSAPFLLFAVAISSWYGGRGPAVLAFILSTVSFYWYFAEPLHTIYIYRSEIPFFIIFTAFVALLSWFGTVRRRVEADLREQAALLNLTHDTVFVVDMKGVIKYWNRGAEERYGWPAEAVLGRVAHDLLKTVFPAPLDEIKAEVTRTGRWEGELLHTKKDGTQLVATSRWSLERGKRGEPVAILETNNDITERKRAEEALRRSEAALRDAIDTIPVNAWSALPDGCIDFMNQRTLEFTGLSRENVLAWGWGSAVHPDDLPGFVEKWRAALAAGKPMEGEARVRDAGGTYHWWLIRNVPLRDELGKIVKWYGTGVDIQDRKQAEEGLHQSEKELRDVFETIPAIVFTTEADGSHVRLNRRWREYTGLTPDSDRRLGLQPENGTWHESTRIHPEDFEGFAKGWLSSASTGEPFEHEARLRRADGQYRRFLVRAVPLRDEQGNILKWFGVDIDIEDRKRAEEKLRQSEAELRQLIDVIPQQVFVFAGDLSPLFANRRELEYTGLTPQEMQSKDAVARVFHPDDLKKLGIIRERAVSNGTPFELEARLRGKDGQYRWFLIRDNPLRDEQGGVIRWYGTRTDIEDRKRAQEALHQAQAELERVNRITIMGEMAASIAHEINQPLTGVVAHAGTCLRWLSAQPPDVEEARQYLALIVRDGNRAADVIGRVRALFKKVPLSRNRLDINEAVRDVIALTHSELQRNSVELHAQLASDLPVITADRVQLQQVILNLIINAVEAMAGVSDKPREMVVATGMGDSNDVFVEIRDSGRGFDPADLLRIFDSFYTTKPDGMGMGLSISRSIIEAHGGRLWATANQPHGAVFRFTLPVEVDTTS